MTKRVAGLWLGALLGMMATSSLGQGLPPPGSYASSFSLGGGGFEWSWGAQEDEESIAAIHRALELGVNWIDTAAQYGFGHSEEVVGRAIAGLRERPLIFTKGGQPEGPNGTTLHSLRRDSLRRELESSLARLGLERAYRRVAPTLRLPVSERYIDWEDVDPVESSVASIKLRVPHAGLAELQLGQATLDQQIAAGKMKLEGRKAAFGEFFGLLDPFEFWFNIVTP